MWSLVGLIRDSFSSWTGIETRIPIESPPNALMAGREMLTAYEGGGTFFLVIERVIAPSPQVATWKEQAMDGSARGVCTMLVQHAGQTLSRCSSAMSTQEQIVCHRERSVRSDRGSAFAVSGWHRGRWRALRRYDDQEGTGSQHR
jgi:hypothetical protein